MAARHRNLGNLAWLPMALALAVPFKAFPDVATGIDAQARFWEQKGRNDLAREAWLKLLQTEPASTDALAGLARIEAGEGNLPLARQYLDQLRKLDPQSPELARIEALIVIGKIGDERLARPRELARAGRYEESAAAYRGLFGGGAPPGGPIALEYWQTVAGVEGGWDPARTGLEQLIKDDPKNLEYRVALAQHLTYREEARREGLDQLMKLADTDAGRQPVQPIWRRALLWLNGRPADRRYYTAYLGRYGEDTQVSARLAALGATYGRGGYAGRWHGHWVLGKHSRALRTAYAHLDAGRYEQAEQAFNAMLNRQPSDADAFAGLGLLRLQQQRFGEAADYLQKATELAPRHAGRLREPLATARYWDQVKTAEAELRAGDTEAAERRLRALISTQPGMADREPTARALLAGLVRDQGRLDEAEVHYREALKADPANPWTRLNLARLLVQKDRAAEAQGLIDGIPTDGPRRNEGLHARALFAAERQDWGAGLAAIEQIPPAERTAELQELRQRLWARSEIERGRELARVGRNDEAVAVLDGVAPQARSSELAAVLAGAYADAGQPRKGLKLMDDVLASQSPPDPVLQKAYDGARTPGRAGVATAAGVPAAEGPPPSIRGRGTVAMGASWRARSGDDGLDQLEDLEIPVELNLGDALTDRYVLRAVYVDLDAQPVKGFDLSRFGTLALNDAIGPAVPQDDSGVAVGATYQHGPWTVDVGSTPLGFEVETVVGGLRWEPKLGPWVLKASLARRSVTESLLSYAGTVDPRSGRSWGGVTSNGLQLDLARDFGGRGFYLNGGYQVYDGKNLEDNSSVGAGGGVYQQVLDQPLARVTLGLNLTSFFYDNNQRAYSFGHGGYFSPEQYLSLSVPMDLVGSSARLSWRLNAAVGYQDFKEDSSDYYPDDPQLQQSLEQFAVANPLLERATRYDSQNSSGVLVNLNGVLEYQLRSHLVLGLRAGFDNARDYEESRFMTYLRWDIGSAQALRVPPQPLLNYREYPAEVPAP